MNRVIVKTGIKDTTKIDTDITKETRTFYATGPTVVASDGYHTFEELYDHRAELWLTICRKINNEDQVEIEMKKFRDGFSFDPHTVSRKVWRSKLHADGSTYEGWFVLGVNKEKGEQITYHLPMSRWDECEWAELLLRAPEWDGHTPADVLERLKTL